jgi:hypothetical protein
MKRLRSGGDGLVRLRATAVGALRVLDICPLVPLETFTRLVGATHRVSAYQRLARLRAARLVDVRLVDLGNVLGGRPVRVWLLTKAGREALRRKGCTLAYENAAALAALPFGPPARPRNVRRQRDLPLLVLTYRLLAAILAEREAAGCPAEVLAWEHPWDRGFTLAGRPGRQA